MSHVTHVLSNQTIKAEALLFGNSVGRMNLARTICKNNNSKFPTSSRHSLFKSFFKPLFLIHKKIPKKIKKELKCIHNHVPI